MKYFAEFLLGTILIIVLVIAIFVGVILKIEKRTCSSFSTQKQAQEYFEKNNATWLDRDSDNLACEELK